jgi:hypothetical protein
VGFTTGPTVDIGTSVGIAAGETPASYNAVELVSPCMFVEGRAGRFLGIVANFVNFFLNIVRARQINDHGGVYSRWLLLFSQQAQTESVRTSSDRMMHDE